ncbi:hypothetical protein KY328_02220 [Candidatus Woesearchaeota archaeon]|nr:hypothetical protein [Candidatus Woesearchaeota archaeon]
MDNNIQQLSEQLYQEVRKRVNNMSLTQGVVKAMEELGEIADLATRAECVQRKDKVTDENTLKDKLAKEICDCIIVLIMTAKSQGIDIIPNLKEVMEAEIERWKAEDD